MRTVLFTTLSLLLASIVVKAQEIMPTFTIIVTPGDSLRETGDMMGAIDAYKKSIASGNIYAVDDYSPERSTYFADTYNLARAFSRIGQQDSAMKYLEQFYTQSNDGVGEALADPDLINIRHTAGWTKLQNLIIKNYCIKSNIQIRDLAYAKILWDMKAADQAYYRDIEIAESKTGKTSSVVMALWDLKRKIGDENLQILETWIKERGWPKISDVGQWPAVTAFLVIQHADLGKQQKYLPVIESLCKTGEARWQDYALMYDRIQLGTNKKQRYGSQVVFNDQKQQYELYPLEDASKVDEWRKKAGLQPLSDYLKQWKIVWPASK